MALVFTTPNMSLPLPIPGQDPGPDYASNQYQQGLILDSHDHSTGRGVQINPTGINLNADLPFNGNNATLLRTVKFTPQSAPLSGASDIGVLYEVGPDLYYNDGGGNQIRFTQGGVIAGAPGTIAGLPSGTASASYSGGTFVFQSATNKPANLDGGSITIRDFTVGSNGVTLLPISALGFDYNIVLPLPPSTKGIVCMDSSGNMTVEPATPPIVRSMVVEETSGSLSNQPVPYDIVIGVGGDYTTLAAGIAAASTDQIIKVLQGTYVENVVLAKRVVIQGGGYGTLISGTFQFSSGSSDSIVRDLRISGNITIDTVVTEISLTNFYLGHTSSFIGDSSTNYLQGFQE